MSCVLHLGDCLEYAKTLDGLRDIAKAGYHVPESAIAAIEDELAEGAPLVSGA